MNEAAPDGWTEEFPQRWVRLMCDFAADGVWNSKGEGCSADSLPISRALLERVRAWQAWFERDAWDGSSDLRPPFDVLAFSAEGLVIARDMKRELPDWTVVYFDQAAGEAVRGKGCGRDTFEHEIG